MVNHKQRHYERYRGWQPIKARKLEVLKFIYDRESITAYDLVNEFGYTYSSARCRLCQLRKEGFIEPFLARGQWASTDKLYRKLDYHGIIKKEMDERLRRQKVEQGMVWLIDTGGRIRMAKNVGELTAAITLQEARQMVQKLRPEGLA